MHLSSAQGPQKAGDVGRAINPRSICWEMLGLPLPRPLQLEEPPLRSSSFAFAENFFPPDSTKDLPRRDSSPPDSPAASGPPASPPSPSRPNLPSVRATPRLSRRLGQSAAGPRGRRSAGRSGPRSWDGKPSGGFAGFGEVRPHPGGKKPGGCFGLGEKNVGEFAAPRNRSISKHVLGVLENWNPIVHEPLGFVR